MPTRSHTGLDIPRTLADCCRPDRMALVVYDMQVGIVGQVADGKTIEATVADILGPARAASFPSSSRATCRCRCA